MSVNIQEIPILVIYYTKSQILCQQEFGSFCNFGTLLEFFNKNIKNEEIQLKQKYFLNNTEIKDSDLLINLIQPYDATKKIINASFSIEIEETNNIGDENFPCFKKILLPVRNKFGLYVFIPEKGTISLEQYPENIEKEYELEKFNINSSYCNSPNALYISGGTFNEEKLNYFWIINNEFYSIQKIKMLYPKSNHSMLYINNNEREIIFIVGGRDLKTFYYDIKNNIFFNWGEMNAIHFHPGLVFIDDYLYCFHLIKEENNKIFFERTNLNLNENNNHIWEKIYPNFESEEIIKSIINMEFGVAPCAGGHVLLIGGNFNNPNCYLYDINMNLFLINDKCKNQFIPLIDKTFYKINKNHNIALPASIQRHLQIVILNKIKFTIRYLNLKPDKENKKIIYSNIHKSEDKIGKVIVEFNTEDVNEGSEDHCDENNQIMNNKNNNSIPIADINISNNIYYEKKLPTMPNDKLISQKNENDNINNKNVKNVSGSKNNFNTNNSNKIKINNNINNVDNGIETDDIIDNRDDEFEEGPINESKDKFNINIDAITANCEIEPITNNIEQDKNIHLDNDNNVVSENEKNADYMIPEKSDMENMDQAIYSNDPDEEIEEKTEENNYNLNINSDENYDENNNNEMQEEDAFEEINEEDMNEFNEEQNYEENGEMKNGQMNEEGENQEEEEEEEGLERDRFELTIVQNIGEDIIQIENFPVFYFEENNFCDYDYKSEDNL
jgi:hypothetical protein